MRPNESAHLVSSIRPAQAGLAENRLECETAADLIGQAPKPRGVRPDNPLNVGLRWVPHGATDNVGTTATAGRVATVPVGSVVELVGGVTTSAAVRVRGISSGGGAWLQYGYAAW